MSCGTLVGYICLGCGRLYEKPHLPECRLKHFGTGESLPALPTDDDLRSALQQANDVIDHKDDVCKMVAANNQTLRAEVERLKKALTDIATGRKVRGTKDRIAIALSALAISPAQPKPEALSPTIEEMSGLLPVELWGAEWATPCCWKCATPEQKRMFIVCRTCGNKRCPHATDHDMGCTGSNEPGQAGSRWDKQKREAPGYCSAGHVKGQRGCALCEELI